MANLNPWLIGLIDGLTATRLILNTNIESRNRLALIILDSTLEVSFKNYLIYVKGIRNIPEDKLENRNELHKIVKRHTNFSEDFWKRIEYFYEKRCELYHEDAGKTLPDNSIFDFFNLVIKVIDELFSINSQALIKNPNEVVVKIPKRKININRVKSKVEAIIIAIGKLEFVKSQIEVIEELKRMGYKENLKPGYISKIMSNKNYKHYFYFDRNNNMWTLSDTGWDKYNRMMIEYGERSEF
jgi:hypothetical protein